MVYNEIFNVVGITLRWSLGFILVNIHAPWMWAESVNIMESHSPN